MAFSVLVHNCRSLRLHKCMIDPDFGSRTVLVEDQWAYCEMWLRRQGMDKALFFWRQAEEFYRAGNDLPKTCSPLTKYYAALNAAKAFLISKNVTIDPYHGLTGESLVGKTSLTREQVRVKGLGVLPQLCHFFGESVAGEIYNLKDILYNLPYIHRAYTITFKSQPELFVPIADPVFVRKHGSSQSWLCFEIKDARFQSEQMMNSLPDYEHDVGVKGKFIVRRKKRFRWKDTDSQQDNLQHFLAYYRKVRRAACYIKGTSRLWYVKRQINSGKVIERSSLTLTYMALHRLSEIARYTPDKLSKHFESQHNWLLSEFINLSLEQFVDEIAAEMTGQEFMPTGYSPR
jgi:hypothetical protein